VTYQSHTRDIWKWAEETQASGAGRRYLHPGGKEGKRIPARMICLGTLRPLPTSFHYRTLFVASVGSHDKIGSEHNVRSLMGDKRRRYREIYNALRKLYPCEPTGNLARHLNTLAYMISGIVGARHVNLRRWLT